MADDEEEPSRFSWLYSLCPSWRTFAYFRALAVRKLDQVQRFALLSFDYWNVSSQTVAFAVQLGFYVFGSMTLFVMRLPAGAPLSEEVRFASSFVLVAF